MIKLSEITALLSGFGQTRSAAVAHEVKLVLAKLAQNAFSFHRL